MSNGDSNGPRWVGPFAVILGLVALSMSVYHTYSGHVETEIVEDEEPDSTRFDYFSISNESDVPLTNVKIWLKKSDNTTWDNCPAGGYLVPDIGPNDVRTWVLRREVSPVADGVAKIEVEVDYIKSGTDKWWQQCVIELGTDWYMNSAEFHFGKPEETDSSPPGDHKLVGHCVTTRFSTGVRTKPHTGHDIDNIPD